MPNLFPAEYIVLYADDDPDDTFLVNEAFSVYAPLVHLITFRNGLALLQHLEQYAAQKTAPCLVILDVNMPRLSGFDVLRRIRNHEHHKELPVVMFSTSSLPAEKQLARSLNAGFVTKPLVADQVSAVAEALLAHCSNDLRKQLKR